MTRGPVSHDRRELAHLHVEHAMPPGRIPQRPFVEPRLRIVISGIKAAVSTRLRERIKARAKLRVEKDREPRYEQAFASRIDQSRRRQLVIVTFEFERAAQPSPDPRVRRAERERLFETVEKFIARPDSERARAKQKSEAGWWLLPGL